MFAPESSCQGTKQTPLRVLLRGTEFQTLVWRALLTIPPSTLTICKDIARRLVYTKNAARAVGRANATNMTSYLVPCHRVIRKTGAIGGYRWGRERKLAMIRWEATRAEQAA